MTIRLDSLAHSAGRRRTAAGFRGFRGLGRASLVALSASVLAAASPSARAILETHVYGIAEFAGAGECGSDPDLTHTVHTKTAERFSDHFDDLEADGDWDDVVTRNNQSADGINWIDASKDAAGDDSELGWGADDADVVFIHTHGYRDANTRSGLLMGDNDFECWVETDFDMFFDDDLDIAIIKACQSGNRDVWLGGGYRQQFTEPASTFTVWNAFHGDSSCGSHVKGYVEDYAEDSDWNGVGENWIDEAYDSDWGANNDDCPVSIVMGSNSDDREHMYEYGGWLDIEDTGDKTGSTIFYISGCDPSDGATLP
jgi:hypothetical protein